MAAGCNAAVVRLGLNSGSKAAHEERVVVSRWLLGVALWLIALGLLVHAVPALVPENDLKSDFYPAGLAVLEHRSPYPPALHGLLTHADYVYPPAYALLLAPLSALRYDYSARIFYWVNIAALAMVALMIGRAFKGRQQSFLGAGFVFASLVSFAPIRWTLAFGQADIYVLVLVTGALALCGSIAAEQKQSESRRAVLAGMLLGIAAAIKVYPVVILVAMLLRRRFQVFISGMLTIAFLVALAVMVSGSSILIDYVRVTQMSTDPRFVAFPFSFGILAFAYRSMTPTPFAVPLVNLPSALVKDLVILAAAVVAIRVISFILTQSRVDARHLLIVAAAALAFFPLLEIQHLSLLMAFLPGLALFTVGGNDIMRSASIRLAMTTAAASLIVAFAAQWTTGRPLVWLTISVASAIGIATSLLLRGHGWSRWLVCGCAIVAMAFVLMASPAFLNMAAWWGAPMSRLHVVLGEGQLYLLFMLIVGVLLVDRGVRSINGGIEPERQLS